MYIRYNDVLDFWEYDTSAGQTGAGPWLILPVDASKLSGSITLPPNIAFKDQANVFTQPQTFPAAIAQTLKINGPVSTDVNTLDFYQEGTWTPIFQGATTLATGQVYTTQVGNYIRIGKLVFCNYEINISNVGSGGAGTLNLNGLPFPAGPIISSGYVYFFQNLLLSIITAAEVVINGQSNIQFYVKNISSGTFDTQILYAHIQSGTRFISSFTYMVA